MALKLLTFIASYRFLIIAGLVTSCTKQEVTSPVVPVRPDSTAQVPGVKRYLALGDSYTIGQSVPVGDRFPVQLASMLRIAGYNISDPEVIATTGWTTGNLLEALKVANTSTPYDAVSLLIGVNNQYQGGSLDIYTKEFTALLTKSIQLAGNNPAKVVVISIPDYSVTPYAENADKQRIAAEIDVFNKVNKELSNQYNVNYVDVTEESRKAAVDRTLVASDGLHFSGKEYRIWAELLLPVMKVILR